MESKIKSYRDLKIWQAGIELVQQIYTIAQKLLLDEKYGLSSQIKRAAVSVPSNIAEGFRRYHNREYKQFLYVALGSLQKLKHSSLLLKKCVWLKTARVILQIFFKRPIFYPE